MSALYNEIDPFAADWLENLILVDAIAPGIVDRRSVEDLTPDYLSGFTQVHLFAGIGVWSYALRQAGWADDRPVWTASFPCQPFSAAGQGGGFDDERHLWPAGLHLIALCRPSVLFGEQVSSKDGLAWLDLVHADMEATGYAFGALDLCSAGVGAPHIRQRTHWMAYATSARREGLDGSNRPNGGQFVFADDGSNGGLVDHVGARLEGRGEGHSATGGRSEQNGPTSPPSSLGGLVDPDGWNTGTERQQRGGEQRFVTSNRGARDEPRGPGPTNGRWADADWLYCRDGKWRPVEPSHVKMVDGVAGSMGYYGPGGRSPDSKTEIADAQMQVLPDPASPQTMVLGTPRGQRGFLSPAVLQSGVHGGRIRGDDKNPQPEEQSASVGETSSSELREMRADGSSRPPSGREPDEQRAREFADIVRLLPPSLARAKQAGDERSFGYLSALHEAILSEGALRNAPFEVEAAWSSLS